MIIIKAWSVASRGRYIGENKPGNPTEQHLEFQEEQGISNAITTVTKDFMVLVMCDDDSAERKKKDE